MFLQKQKIGAELHIYLEEGTYHKRLFRGPSTNDDAQEEVSSPLPMENAEHAQEEVSSPLPIADVYYLFLHKPKIGAELHIPLGRYVP